MPLTTGDLNKIKVIVRDETRSIIRAETPAIVRTETIPLTNAITTLDQRVSHLEDRLETVEEKIDLLPTKDEFFTAMDQYSGEQRTIREELAATHLRLQRVEVKVGLA